MHLKSCCNQSFSLDTHYSCNTSNIKTYHTSWTSTIAKKDII